MTVQTNESVYERLAWFETQLDECRAKNRELTADLASYRIKHGYQTRRAEAAELRIFELHDELDMAIGNLQAIHALSYPVTSVVKVKEVDARANQTDLDVSPEISNTAGVNFRNDPVYSLVDGEPTGKTVWESEGKLTGTMVSDTSTFPQGSSEGPIETTGHTGHTPWRNDTKYDNGYRNYRKACS